MRKIQFNEDTINEIRNYIQAGHSKMEACNRFTLKPDTLSRIMRENNIEPFYLEKRNSKVAQPISVETINLVCNLFTLTDTRLRDICSQTKLYYWQLQTILEDNFSKQEIDSRKARLYRKSKLGNKNAMTGKTKSQHPNYKGLVEDGKGYLMCLKPDWYSSRKKSRYVFYHQVVMCESLGITSIPKGFAVHHIDGNKKNNDISNLCLLQMGAHTKLHQLQNNMCTVQRLSEME